MAMADVQDIITIKNRLIQTALDLASNNPWNDILLSDIADAADVAHDDMAVLFPCKSDIIVAYARNVDHQLNDEMMDAFSVSDSLHDKLFDIMMARFDILNQNRSGVVSIINGLTLDPSQGIQSLSTLCNSMNTIMDIAGIETRGWQGAIKISALSVIYFKSLREWGKDDPPDMAATMAGLDKSLGYFDKIKF